MKGSVQIIREGSDGTSELLFKADNMLVDGLRETIADALTFKPSPSGSYAPMNGVSSVSSYQIQAFSLGSAKDYYDLRDSRFYFSAQQTSNSHYHLLKPTESDNPEGLFSLTGKIFNQWKYENSNLVEDFPYTRFEFSSGKARTVFRRAVPIRLGGDYFVYLKGKADRATLDIRFCRGNNNTPMEYYDYKTNKFAAPLDTTKSAISKTVLLSATEDVYEWKVKLYGEQEDAIFSEWTEYYVELEFPSYSFRDEWFAPWDANYKNPFIELKSFELIDSRSQILGNPRFLEAQSKLLNSAFEHTTSFAFDSVKNLPACEAVGLKRISAWTQYNPLAIYSIDPGTTETASGLGWVKPANAGVFKDTVFSSMVDGVVLYASSVALDSSGASNISQTFYLQSDFRNTYAFGDGQFKNTPINLNAAHGQADGNKTVVLCFDSMVSGEGTAANCGYLHISFIKNNDGTKYNFSANQITGKKNYFSPDGADLIYSFAAKDTWYNEGVPINLPATADNQSYTILIRGSGRVGSGGFCYYGLKNVRVADIGWGLFNYNAYSVATVKYVYPKAPFAVSGELCSSIYVSSNDNYGAISVYTNLRDIINNPVDPNKVQFVRQFTGLEPTKSYVVTIKGGYKTKAPEFSTLLKAKSRGGRSSGSYNILGSWFTDASNPSSTNIVSELTPYSNRTGVTRSTFPSFQKTLDSLSVAPTDWGVILAASASISEQVTANTGEYIFSVDVFNETADGSYFVLSSLRAANIHTFFNWDDGEWESFTPAQAPFYGGETSGPYFLQLPSTPSKNSFDHYKYDVVIPLNTQSNVEVFGKPTLDTYGSRGDWRLTASVYGPTFSGAGKVSISNIAMRGSGLSPSVDIWKELYYDFSNRRWIPLLPAPFNTTTFSALEGPSVNGYIPFVYTVQNPITNMCVSGLDRDAEYQLNVVDISGGEYFINNISITDFSLLMDSGKESWVRDRRIFTSEPYADKKFFGWGKSTVVKLFNNGLLTDPANPSTFSLGFIPPGAYQARLKTPVSFAAATSNYAPSFQFHLLNNSIRHSPWVIRNIKLADYELKRGDFFSIGWDAVAYADSVGFNVRTFIQATGDKGIYSFNTNTSSWEPDSNAKEDSFLVKGSQASFGPLSSSNDTCSWTHIITPRIPFLDLGNTTIIAGLRMVNRDGGGNEQINLKGFRVYKVTETPASDYRVSGDTFLFPEFPSPTHRTLQAVGSAGAELGQFLNRINFFDYTAFSGAGFSSTEENNNPCNPSVTGELTFEQAVSMGAYLPSGGLWFREGSLGQAANLGLLSGTLNLWGVVNSDGYIYPNPGAGLAALDASAGFIASSISDGGSYPQQKRLRYILRIHKDDWRFLDTYYGGIGALGLNCLDYKKSYAKLGTDLHLSAIGSYVADTPVALYNLDPTRNPVFKLVSKKVMFPPGLHIDYATTNFLTIIWDFDPLL